MPTVTLGETTLQVGGELPRPGAQAPDFRLVNADFEDVGLATFAGKRKLLNIVPSLNTSVCAASARRFNEAAPALDNTAVLVVSADLPFVQKSFCATEGIDNVTPLSLMRGRGFAKDYGVLITSGPWEGICARAVVVLDEHDKVLHAQLVPSIDDEPDYDAALAALR